jgi:hypothetical protein
MALEIWKPPAGLNFLGSNAKPPEGQGWQITGYNTVRTDLPKGGYKTSQVPIYGRMAAPATPSASSTAATQQAQVAPAVVNPNLSIGGLDALNRPLTAADRIGQGINTESVEDFMKRLNAQKDWVKAGMDVNNWSPQGEIVKSAPQTPPTPAVDVNKMLQDLQISSQKQMQGLMEQFANQQSDFMRQQAEANTAQMKQMAEAQRTFAINQARANSAKNLQIEGASSSGDMGGTTAFKTRRPKTSQLGSTPLTLASPLNI